MHNNSNYIRAFGEVKNQRGWAADPRCLVSCPTLSERLVCGWDAEEAITTPPPVRGNAPRLITAFGETKSQNDWARDPRCPVTAGAICGRLKRGWSPEDAITTPSTRDFVSLDRLRDHGYLDYKDMARKLGAVVGAPTFYRRLIAGWTVEAAATTPPLPRGAAARKEKP